MNLRSIIITRLAIIYFLMMLVAVLVIVKLLAVQNIKTSRWEEIADNLTQAELEWLLQEFDEYLSGV